MIRDPSDGSVKVAGTSSAVLGGGGCESKTLTVADLPPVSGLPAPSTKTKYQERLDRSREWLRQYRTNPESVVRKMGETGE
jgi:hypothetical protein